MTKKASLGMGLAGLTKGLRRRRRIGYTTIPFIFTEKNVKSETKRKRSDDLHDVIFFFNGENIIQPLKGLMLIAGQNGKINVEMQSAEALLNQSDVCMFSYAGYYGMPDKQELEKILKSMYTRNEKMQRSERVIILFRADISFEAAIEAMEMIGEDMGANNLIFGIYPDEKASDTELYMYGLA